MDDRLSAMNRTIVIGDIHGELAHLERLLVKLPTLDAGDTVVFLGDYLDRGLSSLQVVQRVLEFQQQHTGRCVMLRGNHEDAWLKTLDDPNPGFLLPVQNGCMNMMRSIVDCSHLTDYQQMTMLLQPRTWFPEELRDFCKRLPIWHEDEHAIYVHAGLEGEGDTWLHPSLSQPRNLMWCREPDFFTGYRGKRLCFGHTPTTELPPESTSLLGKLLSRRDNVWQRGDLIGMDTGCGKEGFLSAIELPSCKIYESRD